MSATPWEKWQRKLALLEQRTNHQYQWIPEYKPRLSEPMPTWKEFFRQKEAMDSAMLDKEDVHVFAYELEEKVGTGKRRYVVTSYAQLWHHIHHLFTNKRPGTFYEVIPEGAACKLYFDLEFAKQCNPDLDGNRMVSDFIQIVCGKLKDVYKITCSNEHVINLNASTENKFSCHLVFVLPGGAVFKDNINTGNFVRHICEEIRKSEGDIQQELYVDAAQDGPSPAKRPVIESDHTINGHSLFVKTSDDGESLFIDEGVYTRNRNFRLFKCTKLARNNPLLVADENKYMSKVKTMNAEKRLFLDTLISNIQCNTSTRILTFDDISTRILDDISPRRKNIIQTTQVFNQSTSTEEGYGFVASPFPELDTFIRNTVANGDVRGDIRRWIYFSESRTMLYEIANYRFCENIGRQHKSNNIMILVDLKRRIYYQKCHDPDCKGFKSVERPLSADCWPVWDEYDDEDLLTALDGVEEFQQETENKNLFAENRRANVGIYDALTEEDTEAATSKLNKSINVDDTSNVGDSSFITDNELLDFWDEYEDKIS